jgi:hypothetical protein
MKASLIFLSGLGVTLAMAVGTAIYLKSALGNILNELCGTRDRAAFWTAFSNIAVTAVPLIFAMQYTPDTGAHTNTVFELVTQLKWGLIGLVATVVTLGWVLSRFIVRASPPSVTAKAVPAME